MISAQFIRQKSSRVTAKRRFCYTSVFDLTFSFQSEGYRLVGILGHLNILYIAMKLVESEVNRNRELLNIMIIEKEPEAHIHTHIQKTLFNNSKLHIHIPASCDVHTFQLIFEVSDIERSMS